MRISYILPRVIIVIILISDCFQLQGLAQVPRKNMIDGNDNKKKISLKQLTTGPDIILHNAYVITMDDQLPVAEAIAVKGNRITAVGLNSEVLALQTANTQIYDLEGRTVIPGLIEAHSHQLTNAFNDNGLEGVMQATQEMAAEGYTTVHQTGCGADFVSCLQKLAENGELAIRVGCYLWYNGASGVIVSPEEWDAFPYTVKTDTTLRIIGVKIFADGGSWNSPATTTIQQFGQWAGTYGTLYKTQEEMNATIGTILQAGYPIAMHAMGDSAIGVGLNAFEHAFGGSGNTLRSRIEHVSLMREDLADQMAALGVCASIQYTWATTSSIIGMEKKYLPEALEWCYAWRRLADRGIPIVGGTDYPFCSTTNPMQTISLLATRKGHLSDVVPDSIADDCLTVEEGLRGLTVTNAWVAFEENCKGSITVGKLADITVLSDNLLGVDPFNVRYIDVEMTIMDGVIRYNQIGIIHTAVHDAGIFKMGVDDKGMWGSLRTGVGLEYNGLDYLYQGSVMIAYADGFVASANFFQEDFITSQGGMVNLEEPGQFADQEIQVIYEDGAAFHSDKLRIIQKSYMWNDEPFLLVKYDFENICDHPVENAFLGQGFDFDVGHYGSGGYFDNLADWDENNGLGFAYMYNAFSPEHPYIGVAMFDTAGNAVNTGLSFSLPIIFKSSQEQSVADAMRSGISESGATEASDYSILLSRGPLSLAAGESISPFMIAVVVGDDLQAVESGVQAAYLKSREISDNSREISSMSILTNGDFTNDMEGWEFGVSGSGSGSGTIENGTFHASISNGGSAIGDITLTQYNLNLEQGKEYGLTLKARTAGARTIRAQLVSSGSSPVVYDDEEFNITDSWFTFVESMTMTAPSDATVRLIFSLGAFDQDVYLDDIRLVDMSTTAVEPKNNTSASSFVLSQNYPNPFNPETTISFSLACQSVVTLTIYDIQGHPVKELLRGSLLSGRQQVVWNGRNTQDQPVASGLYIYRIEACATGSGGEERYTDTGKMLLLK